MTFKRRLLLYLIGFGIGLLVVFVFVLRDKKFDYWTPSEMIKSRIAEKPFLTTEKSKCQMDCLKYYPEYVMMKVKRSKLEFKPGEEIHKRCKTYTLISDSTSLIFEICPTTVTLQSIQINGHTNCGCE